MFQVERTDLFAGVPSEACPDAEPVRVTRTYNRHRQMSLSPGTRIGIYQIEAALAAGGMGEVFRARDTKLGRQVAIKVYRMSSRAIGNGLRASSVKRVCSPR